MKKISNILLMKMALYWMSNRRNYCIRRENINTNLKLSYLGADGREKVRYKAQKFMAMRLTFS